LSPTTAALGSEHYQHAGGQLDDQRVEPGRSAERRAVRPERSDCHQVDSVPAAHRPTESGQGLDQEPRDQ